MLRFHSPDGVLSLTLSQQHRSITIANLRTIYFALYKSTHYYYAAADYAQRRHYVLSRCLSRACRHGLVHIKLTQKVTSGLQHIKNKVMRSMTCLPRRARVPHPANKFRHRLKIGYRNCAKHGSPHAPTASLQKY